MDRPDPLSPVERPDPPPRAGQTKVTRDDWLRLARDILVRDGIAEVKIARLGQRLGVSRSSFYWYFKNLDDLCQALLQEWEARTTGAIQHHCAMRAPTITRALVNFFKCFVDPALFDHGLDFAVREWARRDGAVRARIDAADTARLDAITAMFARHGYGAAEADIRARILYFMQLGYHALDQREPVELRLSRVEGFLAGFTGQTPAPDDVAALRDYWEQVRRRDPGPSA